VDQGSPLSSDLALTYLTIAGPDASDANSIRQPPVHAAAPEQTQDLTGLRIGAVTRGWSSAYPIKLFHFSVPGVFGTRAVLDQCACRGVLGLGERQRA
jgi:hypothetical protein